MSSGLSISNVTMWLRNKCFYSSYVSFALGDCVSSHIININKNDAGEVLFPIKISTSSRQFNVSENLGRVCFTNQKSTFRYSKLTINDKTVIGMSYSLETDTEHVLSSNCKNEHNQGYNESKSFTLKYYTPEVTTLDGPIC